MARLAAADLGKSGSDGWDYRFPGKWNPKYNNGNSLLCSEFVSWYLHEAGVEVGAEDRVEPDLWVELEDGMVVRVIRVQQEIIVERQVLPYAQQTIKSEALPAGEAVPAAPTKATCFPSGLKRAGPSLPSVSMRPTTSPLSSATTWYWRNM